MMRTNGTLFSTKPISCAEMEDEFMDEDIDERAEDIAEGINTQVHC